MSGIIYFHAVSTRSLRGGISFWVEASGQTIGIVPLSLFLLQIESAKLLARSNQNPACSSQQPGSGRD